jgi:hypothetical protein
VKEGKEMPVQWYRVSYVPSMNFLLDKHNLRKHGNKNPISQDKKDFTAIEHCFPDDCLTFKERMIQLVKQNKV